MKRENKGKAPKTEKQVRVWLNDGTNNPACIGLVSDFRWNIGSGQGEREGDITHYEIIQPKAEKKPDTRPLEAGHVQPLQAARQSLNGKRFVLTSAQNNTPVHKPFLDSLLRYCGQNDARLIVGKMFYNKNGFQNQNAENDDGCFFAKELEPYFLTEQTELCSGLVWCGEVNILPTAKYPLSAMQQYAGKASTIFPHCTISLESVATSKGLPAKIMYSTGAITQRNFIPKKAGQIADSRFTFGALIVEITEEGLWFVRQIEANEFGEFQDLDKLYSPNCILSGAEILAVNLGDIHAEKTDKAVLSSCADMLETLAPDNVVLHDLFDFTSRNHHNRNNPHFLAEQAQAKNSVRGDLSKCGEVLRTLFNASPKFGVRFIVVESNHDLALQRWLEDMGYQFQMDPLNARIYCELQAWKYAQIESGKDEPGLLEHALQEYAGICATDENLLFLVTDESLVVADVELGFHGHNGINGARGSPKSFQLLNMKINTGHTHSASIYGGVYTAGVTGSLDQGYNKGPSNWSHSHILTYATGARTIVTMQQTSKGEWLWCAP